MTTIQENRPLSHEPLLSVPEDPQLPSYPIRIYEAPGIPSHAASLEMNRMEVRRQIKAAAACALIGSACLAIFFTLINKYLL